MDPTTAWTHALTLSERLRLPTPPAAGSVDPEAEVRARHRLRAWRDVPAYRDDPSALPGHLNALLTESRDDLARRHGAPPRWAEAIRDALSAPGAETLDRDLLDRGALPEFVLVVTALDPFLGRGRAALRRALRSIERLPPPAADPDALVELLFDGLPRQLAGYSLRTLILELNVARVRGQLEGPDPGSRFRSFVRRLRDPAALRALFDEYPVLARQVHQRVDQWARGSARLIADLAADWPRIVGAIPEVGDAGRLDTIELGAGDTHRDGRSVAVLAFSGGVRLVYKPRAVGVEARFQALLGWLNARTDAPPLRALRLVDAGDRGWAEFVPARPCDDAGAVQRFYQRQGALLALTYALRATDFHFENVVAHGEHPVLVDLEALFHPDLADPPPASAGERAMAGSVLGVGLLPQRTWMIDGGGGIDVSGLGGEAGQLTPDALPTVDGSGTDAMSVVRRRMPLPAGHHRPTLRGAPVDPLDHVDAIERGFASTYRTLLAHREDLLAELDGFAGEEVRLILRPTRTYALLLQESFHPNVLRDALDRDRLLDRLRPAGNGPLAAVQDAERVELERGDVPVFVAAAGSCTVRGATGEIPGLLGRTPLEQVRERIASLCPSDLERQRWFVRGALCALSIGGERRREAPYEPVPPRAPASADRLVAAAVSIADRIAAVALGRPDATSWLGLTLTTHDTWALRPLGADLYAGLPGVAWFLAEVGRVAELPEHVALAREATRTWLDQLDYLGDSEGVGAFGGWGGHVYVLTHLAGLLEQPDLLGRASALVPRIAERIAADERYDVVGGAAGAILGLLSLHRCAPDDRIPDLVRAAGAHLVRAARDEGAGLGWPNAGAGGRSLAGYAHGAAGVAHALIAAGDALTDRFLVDAGLAAIAFERTLFDSGAGNWRDVRPVDGKLPEGFLTAWCHGAPGVGLGRIAVLPHVPVEHRAGILSEIQTAVETTIATGFGGNHSLCHGDLGNLDLLLDWSRRPEGEGVAPALQALSSAVLASVEAHGPCSGNPLRAESPGLMTGLAGIGRGLLRLADPSLPSVLRLQPPGPP